MTQFHTPEQSRQYISSLRHANLLAIANSEQFNSTERAKARIILARELLDDA